MDLPIRHLVHSTPLAQPSSRVRRATLLVLAATLLFALGPTVLKLIMQRGAQLGLGITVISFCNVLFVGNLCAGLVVLSVKGPRRIGSELVRLPRRVRGWLLVAALVSTIYPALLFIGLERTTVTNVVLLSRFNGIVYVLLGWLFLRDVVSLPSAVSYGIIALGVGALVLANLDGLQPRSGEIFVLVATVFFALTEIVSRKVLPHVSIHTYVFVRNFVSSIIFFAFASVVFGPSHFMDAFRGDLWILMGIYALFAIVVAQILWLSATRVLPAKTVADVQLLSPVFSIVFALLLLREAPDPMQWLVMAIIAAGMLVPVFWHGRRPAATTTSIDTGLVAK